MYEMIIRSHGEFDLYVRGASDKSLYQNHNNLVKVLVKAREKRATEELLSHFLSQRLVHHDLLVAEVEDTLDQLHDGMLWEYGSLCSEHISVLPTEEKQWHYTLRGN